MSANNDGWPITSGMELVQTTDTQGMTPLHLTITEMRNRGGSFVSALGSLLVIADPENRKILLESFPGIISKYAAIAELEETKRILQGSLIMFPEQTPNMPQSLNQFTN